MGLGFSILGGLLVLLFVYLGWRIRQQQQAILDFQLTYHKTMTPAQIKNSRHFFFQSEIKKSAVKRRLHLGVQLGRWSSYGLFALILAQQFGMVTAVQPQSVTLSWIGLLATLTARNLCQWRLNQQLYASVQIKQLPDHVDLMMTPTQFTQPFLKYQLWSIGTLAALLMIFVVASWTETLPADYSKTVLNSFLIPPMKTAQSQQSASSSSSSSHFTVTYTEKSSSSSSSSQPQTKEDKAYTSAAYVRSLPVKSQSYLTTQDHVGLISMYYLALNHYDYDGIANDSAVKYEFHIIKNLQPLTIVVTSTQQKFVYLTQIDKQNYVRIYKFNSQTPSALHGLVPAYTEYPNSKVKLGQLINGYYSDQDGPYHRTMWAMEPGTDWTY